MGADEGLVKDKTRLFVRDGRIRCYCYACGGSFDFIHGAAYAKTRTRGNQVFCLACGEKLRELEVAWELMG